MKSEEFKVVYLIDEENIVINAGSNKNVKKGDHFLIYGLSDEVFDIDNNESLGKLELVRGEGVVVHVQEKMSIVRSNIYEKEDSVTEIRSFPNLLGRLGAFGNNVQEERIVHPAKKVIIPFMDVEKGDYVRKI